MSKSTPGPWGFGPSMPRPVTLKRQHWVVGQNGGTGVALAFGDDEANARLIAAAPELLAACKAIMTADNYDEIEMAKELARLAIAKAEPQ